VSLPEVNFEEFLRQLAAQRGTTGKLRFAARFADKLRRLPDSERRRVALALGSEAAWNQLERLFLRDLTLSGEEQMVQQALDRLGSSDPAELRRWAQVLRGGDPRKVGELVATAVQAALEQTSDETAPAGEEGGSRLSSAPTGEEGERRWSSAPTGEEGERRWSSAPAAEEAESRPAPPAPAPAPPSPGPSVAAPPDTDIGTADRVTEAVISPADPRRFHGPPHPLPSHRFGPPPFGRPAGVAASQSLRELRELHRNPAGVAALGADGRAELVARLGSGWASRRAVSAMIRSGAVAGVDEALQLIAGLDTPARRNWCLGVLLDSFELTEGERERVLEAVPSAAARRRLAARSRARSPRL
jgi:hypothetical protein